MIKSIEVENFMSIEHGRVEFDESNIICLCGYNDSGKSAFTEAIEILFYDSYSRDQVAFIQDGKDYFKVTMEFDDNIVISKTKYSNGNGVWELSQSGTVLYTNRLDGAIASVDKVPEPIEKYLGVVYDEYTQSLLNVRRNRDKLLLVGTSGGDNYKIFNSILKSDLLAETSKRLNTDKNSLNAECNNKTNALQTMETEIDCMNCASEDSLQELNQRIASVAELYEQSGTLEGIKQLKNEVDSFVDWGELQEVSADSFARLAEIKRLHDIISEPIYDECTLIDTSRFDMLNAIKTYKEKAESIEIVPEIQVEGNTEIMNRYEMLKTIIDMSNTLERTDKEVKEISEQMEMIQKELVKYADEYKYKICPNCGTVVV